MKVDFSSRRAEDKLLVLFLLVDVFIVLLDVSHFITGRLGDPFFSIDTDRGFGESFQYVKEICVVLLLLFLAARKPSGFLYASWAIVFGCLWVDDCLMVHERLGRLVSSHWGFLPVCHLRARDLGELCVLVPWGALLIGLIAVAHWLSGEAARRFSRGLFLLFVLLIVFGVVGDPLHSILTYSFWGDAIGSKVEDGGEMVMMSLIFWYVLRFGESDDSLRRFFTGSTTAGREEPS